MSKPISIVTVVFNDQIGLRKTLDSISNQTSEDYELVIIDGGSTDGTLDVVKEYGELVSCVTSEADDGIYDAMNKGLDQSTGEWVIFMNAGDEFHSENTLSLALKEMNDPDTTYFGRAQIVADSRNSWLYPSANISTSNIDKWLRHKLPNHQAIFFPRSFYSKNRYDLKFIVSSDSDYKIRALGGDYCYMDLTISNFYLGGVSSEYKFSNLYQQFKDRVMRKSGKGGVWYALTGLISSIAKLIIYRIYGSQAPFVVEKLKRLIR
ncbi:MAG: glycosyltransferase [Gammaproteobacteria bacterium]|nr:glycosyltransferase [Gammaproteobacteria bacterium]